MYRVLIGALVIMITNITFALESEFKNTLNKVELNKTSDSSYSVNLYTSKEYSEPVKVIKKNDLSYYILLPETKNSAAVSLPSSPEIKNVNTQLFPHAGADVNNGYTKINITTTKPINFTVSTKNKVASTAKKPVETEIKKEENKVSAEGQAQKKNSEVLVQKLKPSLGTDKSKNTVKQETKTTSKEVKPVVKQETKQETKIASKEIKAIKPEIKPAIRELKQGVAAAAKITADKTQEVKNEQPKILKTEDTPQKTDEILEEDKNIEEQSNIAELSEDIKPDIEEKSLKQEDIEVVRENSESSISALSNFKNKLSEYGLSFRELILMIFAGILSFVIMLLILTKQKEGQTRIKSKAEFIEKTTNKNSSLVAKKPSKKERKDQYFVFDKNVKQTGFSAPASGNRNYELSSYSPIPEEPVAKVEPYVSKRVKSEYDIIQNILKEDAFIELSDNDIIKEAKSEAEIEKEAEKASTEPIEHIQEPEPVINTDSSEPQVLSNVEIAPQRGFMCVAYNNTINLMGYIFDDIFALYNFKQPKLEDYSIKFRMSEKTKQGANFLVRIGKSKMLVSVTKSSMNLEVAM